MKRFMILLLVVLASGCSSRGEGLTINGDGLHVGTSLAARDQIAQDKADAEIAQIAARTQSERDRTAAGIEQSAEFGKVTRPAILAIGLAAALVVAAIGVGYASKQATPLAAQGVEALRVRLDIRKVRSLEVILQIGPGGYNANLTAIGYEPGEIAQIISNSPALNAPRLAELQGRVGGRGMQLLANRGEIEEALLRLPEHVEGVISDD